MDKRQRDGLLLILIAAFGYAIMPIFTKSVYSTSDLDPISVAVWRFGLAAPLLWLLIRARHIPNPEQNLPRYRLLGLGVIFGISALSAFVALQHVTASMYIVLFFSYPAIVAVLSAVLGKPLPSVGWLALGLTLFGVYLTVPDLNTQGSLLGIAAVMSNAFLMALYFIVSDHLLRGHRSMARGTAWVITGSCMTLLALGLIQGVMLPPNLATWAGLLAMATIGTVLPIFAINAGIQKIGPARAAIIVSVQPVETMIMAMILLGDVILPVQWVGAGLIISSVLLLQLRPQRPQATASAEEAAALS